MTVNESMQMPVQTDLAAFGEWPSTIATQTRTLELHFPEMVEGQTIQVQALPGFSVTVDGQNPQFVEGEDVFISPESLIDQLRKTNLPLSLEGWHNPTLRIGQTAVTIGTRDAPVTAAQWYSNVLIDGTAANAPKDVSFTWNQQLFGVTTLGKHIYSMRVNDRPGTVYGLFMSETNPNQYIITGPKQSAPLTWVGYTLARVNDSGVLQFVDGSAKVIEFVKSFKGISDDLEFLKANKFDADRLGKLGYGSAKRPAKAMLVRLTGRLDANTTEIVVPAKLRLMGFQR